MKNKNIKSFGIPDWYIEQFSKEEIKELENFKEKVDEAVKFLEKGDINKLVEVIKIKEKKWENLESNLYFKKSFDKIIFLNPLFLNFPNEELKRLVENYKNE